MIDNVHQSSRYWITCESRRVKLVLAELAPAHIGGCSLEKLEERQPSQVLTTAPKVGTVNASSARCWLSEAFSYLRQLEFRNVPNINSGCLRPFEEVHSSPSVRIAQQR